MVPSETRESLRWRSDVGGKYTPTGSNKVLPASQEKILRMLAVGGQVLEEARVFRLHFMTEVFVSVREGEQLGVLLSGVGQGTRRGSPCNKRGRSEDRGIKRPEESVE